LSQKLFAKILIMEGKLFYSSLLWAVVLLPSNYYFWNYLVFWAKTVPSGDNGTDEF
jgi:hypothetical protein